MTRLLVDIGGTYARFAIEKNGAAENITKYAAEDFKTFTDAVLFYAEEVKAGTKLSLRISTAAHQDGKVWRFVNKNKWVLDPAVLKRENIKTEVILNDFEAAAWGLFGLKSSSRKALKAGKKTGNPVCLVGPGTGLGLAYLSDGWVQKTMGGHLPAAAVTAEQELIVQAIVRIKKRPGIVVYEDLVSGQGLVDIYYALCDIDKRPKDLHSAEELLEQPGDRRVRTALRLFHEFFALFAATVTVAGNSYGGLYLTGGVTDRLYERKLFDFAHFEKFFLAGFVPSIEKALDDTGVFYITDPYLALVGLMNVRNA